MITAEQRIARKSYIGASETAAIMGLDRYSDAATVWLEKTGQLNEWQGNENTHRGNLLEPVILNWAQQHIPDFDRDQMRVHANGVMAANFDGICDCDQKFIVQAKSSVVPEEWGETSIENPTDDVPDRVVIQTHAEMAVAGPEFRFAFVPVLLPGFRSFDFRLYRVDRRDELCHSIEAECVNFMESFVRPLIRPSEYRPSLDVLKRVKRIPSKVVPIEEGLVDAMLVAKAKAKIATEAAKETEALVLAAMGDAEGATYGRGEITYFETNRKGYQVEPCTFRTLRVKPAKK